MRYIRPEMEILQFQNVEIITTSIPEDERHEEGGGGSSVGFGGGSKSVNF